MPGSPVLIGPFVGGLNTYSDPTIIGDNECVELTNVDIDIDGTVLNRPALTTMPSSLGNGGNILGTYVTTTGVVYFVAIDQSKNLKVYDVTNAAALYTIATNIDTQCVIQYANKLWIIATPNSANPGGSWDPAGGFVAVTTMGRGVSAVIYKERMFVATGVQSATPSRINFSPASNPGGTWNTGTDFFDANNGDGQSIVKIYSFMGKIAIFKTRSTYTFGYDSQPTKGQTDLVAATVGIANVNSFAEFENVLYVLYQNNLYSITNWNWDIVNVKVPFQIYRFKTRSYWSDSSLSIVGNRLICRYSDNFYVYNLRLRVFTLWRFEFSDLAPSHWLGYPYLDATTNQMFYVAANYDNAKPSWYKMIDTSVLPGGIGESYTIALTTKTYDYKVPYTFKRMFWWGADILSKTQINFLVHPTVYNVPIKWSAISAGSPSTKMKWSQLKTWGKPVDVSIDVSDSVNTPNPSQTRTFMKLKKGLRFRQINFKLTTMVDGTITTTPFRVFSLTAVTSSKSLVSKNIN